MAQPLKNKAGSDEEKSQLATIVKWAFIVLGIAGIVWMIAVNPREKTLNCDSAVRPGLTNFGTCTAE